MNYIKTIISEIWIISKSMSIYLIFGFIIAGIIYQLISDKFIKKHLGRKSFLGPIKGALFGIPFPICSCGILPLAVSIKKQGASTGSTISFLTSTPQTGIDSLIITYALLGPIFTILRAVMSFVSGIICGYAMYFFNDINQEDDIIDFSENEIIKTNLYEKIINIFKYGFLELPKTIAKPLIFGIGLSALINTFIPTDFFYTYSGNVLISILLMLIISFPIYVCSTASVPVALSFISLGISPGAILVFLIIGPATNMATITTLIDIIGRIKTFTVIIVLSLCAIFSGLILNIFLPSIKINDFSTNYHCTNSLLEIISVIFLYIILLLPFTLGKLQTGR